MCKSCQPFQNIPPPLGLFWGGLKNRGALPLPLFISPTLDLPGEGVNLLSPSYTKSNPVECRGLVAHCKTEEIFAEKIGPFLGTEFWSHPFPSHFLESLSVEDIYGKI